MPPMRLGTRASGKYWRCSIATMCVQILSNKSAPSTTTRDPHCPGRRSQASIPTAMRWSNSWTCSQTASTSQRQLFHRSGRQSLDDVTFEENPDDGEGRDRGRGQRCHRPPVDALRSCLAGYHHRKRRGVRAGQQRSKEIFIPAKHDRKDERGDETG